jgi:leader peptidase (prepilin peptidase)/N-methyltransferase
MLLLSNLCLEDYLLASFWFVSVFFLFASIGSFLNVVAYRLVYEKPFFTGRSYCPWCGAIIPWFYNIPIFSFFYLSGQSACCQKPISWLYSFIEFLSAIVLSGQYLSAFLYQSNISFLYIIPLSALLIAIRTDLEAMVILTPFSLWIAPVGLIFAAFGFLSISLFESFMGVFFGYVLLWSINAVVKKIRGQEGIGEGDMDLMALIGSFWGIVAIPYILWMASIIGVGLSFFMRKQEISFLKQRIPFGPCLAFATFLWHFWLLYGVYVK